jgi:hypothetical protein
MLVELERARFQIEARQGMEEPVDLGRVRLRYAHPTTRRQREKLAEYLK